MMRLTKQFLITEKETLDLSKILSIRLIEEEYTSVAVYPFLVLGTLLIIFLHPLCSLPVLAIAAWFAVCQKKKELRVVVTVCTASTTYMVKLSDSKQFKELEAAISTAKQSRNP